MKMVVRLGKVLYWTAYGLALLYLVTAVLCLVMSFSDVEMLFAGLLAMLIAVGIWLAGRAIRYVLVGR